MPYDFDEQDNSNEGVYGPVLPSKVKSSEEEYLHVSEPSTSASVNQVPSPQIIGPALPPSFNQQEQEIPDNDFCGPALPPRLLKRKLEEEEAEDITLKKFQSSVENNKMDKKSEEENSNDDSDDDDIIGPVPAGCGTANSSFAQQKLEERAWRLKTEFLKKDQTVDNKREEWMLELPPANSTLGLCLGPRKFKTREGPDMSDRSCWTDTPVDRERKLMEKMNKATYEKPRKDKKKDKESSRDKKEEKKSKKKEKSLMEMHQEKMKEKRKKEEKEAKEKGRTVRRPFDRDIDLKIGGCLSQKEKRTILSDSKLLSSKFCHSKM